MLYEHQQVAALVGETLKEVIASSGLSSELASASVTVGD